MKDNNLYVSKIWILSIFVLFFSINLLAQNTYYISLSNGNDSNSGKSISSPWKNLSKVNSTNFYPGDKILFNKGDKSTGQWYLKSQGTSSSPIVIGSYGSGSLPIFDGNNTLQYLLGFYTNVNYINIEGIDFRNCDPDHSNGSRGLIYGSSNNHNIEIKDCLFSQGKTSSNSSYALIYMNDASYITIENCDLSGKAQGIHFRSNNNNHRDVHHILISNNNFHDIIDNALGRAIRFSSNTNDGIGSTLGAEGIIRDITISANNFNKISSQAIYHEDTQKDGIPIWLQAGLTSYNIIIQENNAYRVEWCFLDWGRIADRGGKFNWSRVAKNIIDYCGFDINGNPTTKYPTNAINTHAWKEVYIEDNIISNVANNQGDGKAIILDHSVDKTKYICDGVVIRRNILSGIRHTTLNYAGAIHVSKGTNCKIYNNVCYDNISGITLEGPLTTNNQVYDNTLDGNNTGFWFGTTTTGNKVENNIFSNNKDYGIKYNSNLQYDYNLFFNNGSNYKGGPSGAHDLYGDPKYQNRASHNFQLTSSSPAIDKGISISGLTTDILGNLIQNKVDIGAYEYTTSSISSMPSVPLINSPSIGATDISTSPILIWNSSTNTTSYTLQVSTNSSFSSYLFNQSGLTSTSKQISSGLLNNTKYYWRVSAVNSYGASAWSTVYYFVTQAVTSPTSNGAYIIFGTNSAVLNGDVHLKQKTGSIGSKVLYFLNSSSTAKYTVNLDKSAEWYAWGRMLFESSGAPRNSFYIQVDNGPKLVYGDDDNSGYDVWNWEGNKSSKLNLGNLSAGNHTITISGREIGTGTVLLDQILLTADASLAPTDNLIQGTNNGNLIIASDKATLNGDVHLKQKTGSIGSKVLYFLNSSSTAKYTVNLDKSAEWYAWGRMLFESSGAPRNSFYIQVDNGPKLVYGDDDNSGYDVWNWEGNKSSKLNLGNLSAGNHTITISGREIGTGTVLLDQILLTADASLAPTDNLIQGTNNGNLIIASDKATLNGDVHLKQKTGSIGSKVLYFLNSSSTAKYTVNLDKSAEWYAWGRMLFESSGAPRNSFYIQVDNGPKLVYGDDDNSGYDVWNWEGNKSSKLNLGNLSAGNHTIIISGREIGTGTVLLDQLLLTSDASLIPDNNIINFNKSTSDSAGNSLINNDNTSSKPIAYVLSQNYPNPFNPTTTINFSITKDGFVSLKVYDILGSEVASILDEVKTAGSYNILFDASKLSSGIYFYRLSTPNFTQVKKMTLVK